jgi:hypothetical protein
LDGQPGGKTDGDKYVVDDNSVWFVCEKGKDVGYGEVVAAPVVAARCGCYGLVQVGGEVLKVKNVALDALEGERGPLPEGADKQVVTTPRADGAGDVRTLAVDFDSQNSRHKEWRQVVSEAHFADVDSFPMEGPPSLHFLIRHFHRHGGTPRGWLALYLRDKGLSQQDRVSHELAILCEILELGGSFDQLNLPSLAAMECAGRRIQAIIDAHAVNPQRPNYDSATLFAGTGRATDGVSPDLKNFVARKARDEADVEKSRQKIRELRAEPAGAKGKKGDGSAPAEKK